ncbi:hypothetical protein HXZ79_07975 [Acinetobacter indicus]|nr:hypothetical protein [Acinetobacter indicus]
MANTRNEGTSNRGFASMDPDEQREIASRGGRAAHASGNAHEFTSEEARRGRNRDDDDDDRRGRSSSSSTRKRDRYGRFTSD